MYRPTIKQLTDFQSRENIEVDHIETIKNVVIMVDINYIPTFCYFITPHETCMEVHLMATSQGVKKYPLTFQKTTKQMIRNAFEVYEEIDIMVMDVAPCDEKWAKTLGFKKGPNYDNLESIEGFINYVLKREDI